MISWNLAGHQGLKNVEDGHICCWEWVTVSDMTKMMWHHPKWYNSIICSGHTCILTCLKIPRVTSVPRTFSYDGQLKRCYHVITILPLLCTATSFYMPFHRSQQSCRFLYTWFSQWLIGFDLDIRSSHASVWTWKGSQQQWVSCDAR